MAVAAAFESDGVEGSVVASVAAAHPAGAPLFIASSLPVRHLDQFAAVRTTQMPVYCNRAPAALMEQFPAHWESRPAVASVSL